MDSILPLSSIPTLNPYKRHQPETTSIDALNEIDSYEDTLIGTLFYKIKTT